MSKILINEISRLEKRLLTLSGCAEENLHKAVKAVTDRDRVRAQAVIAADAQIDRQEVDLEEEGLKLLALHRPVAGDLRFIVAVIKMNSDLERIGDLAETIARQALLLADRPEVPAPFDLQPMAARASAMIRDTLDALIRADVATARQVRAADKEVDALHHANLARVENAIRTNVEAVDAYLAYLSVSRSLERIADHAKDIAADILYMLEGEIVRHPQKAESDPAAGPPVDQRGLVT